MRNPQATIKKPFHIQGREPMGNKRVKLSFTPAPENTGIIFNSPSGHISPTLKSIRPERTIFDFSRTMALNNGTHQVFLSEHLLGTTLGMGLDNAYIDIETTPSNSYTILSRLLNSQNIAIVPYFGRKLYEALIDNLDEQNTERRLITLEDKVESDKLSIEPTDKNGIIFDIKSTIYYQTMIE